MAADKVRACMCVLHDGRQLVRCATEVALHTF
jgi:hypothetical protein